VPQGKSRRQSQYANVFQPRAPRTLAEDNPVNRRIAVRFLENLGCLVDVATNGLEAMEMAVHFSYEAIFMDCGTCQRGSPRRVPGSRRGRLHLQTYPTGRPGARPGQMVPLGRFYRSPHSVFHHHISGPHENQCVYFWNERQDYGKRVEAGMEDCGGKNGVAGTIVNPGGEDSERDHKNDPDFQIENPGACHPAAEVQWRVPQGPGQPDQQAGQKRRKPMLQALQRRANLVPPVLRRTRGRSKISRFLLPHTPRRNFLFPATAAEHRKGGPARTEAAERPAWKTVLRAASANWEDGAAFATGREFLNLSKMRRIQPRPAASRAE
jgi:hypothetical protein